MAKTHPREAYGLDYDPKQETQAIISLLSNVILAKRVTDRVGGAKRRVSIRCRAKRAKADANLDQGL